MIVISHPVQAARILQYALMWFLVSIELQTGRKSTMSFMDLKKFQDYRIISDLPQMSQVEVVRHDNSSEDLLI